MNQDYPFEFLTRPGLRKEHSWLINLPSKIARIANFGCWSGSEPFAFLWTLDAKEVMVIEIEENYIGTLKGQFDMLNSKYPESLQGHTVNHLCRDMTKHIPELTDGYFDLAYCSDVLYAIAHYQGSQGLRQVISQMIRVVKLGGIIIASEPKFGVKFESLIPKNEPKDMSLFFPLKEVRKLEISDSPAYTYCYQKVSE